MFVWTDLAVLKLFLHLFRKKKEEEENLALLDLSASPQVKRFFQWSEIKCTPKPRKSIHWCMIWVPNHIHGVYFIRDGWKFGLGTSHIYPVFCLGLSLFCPLNLSVSAGYYCHKNTLYCWNAPLLLYSLFLGIKLTSVLYLDISCSILILRKRWCHREKYPLSFQKSLWTFLNFSKIHLASLIHCLL